MRALIASRILLLIASLITLVALGFLARLSWQVHGPAGWRDEVYALVGLHGTRQAMDDFRAGRLRLFRLGGEQERPEFIGETHGVFEIWTPQFYPDLGPAHRYSKEQFIEFYNRKMEYMYSRPDRFSRSEEEVEPDGPGNESKPIHAETNRTSVTAGSDR